VLGLGLAVAIPRVHARGAGQDAARKARLVAIAARRHPGALVDEFGIALWAAHAGSPGLTPSLHLSLLWAASSAVTNACLVLLKCQDRLAHFGAVSLLQSVVAEATSLGLVVFARPSAEMFVLGQVVAQVLAAGVGLAAVRPAPLRCGDRALLGSSLAFGLPLIPSSLSMLLLSLSDRFVIAHQLGQVAVAPYQIAANIGTNPGDLIGVLHTSWIRGCSRSPISGPGNACSRPAATS